ncbi:30S ribosomal protein S9 [Sedimentisphaera cyanobacteriorum]|uniref:Small ribosomal subunit protein uS9 n=1 Tax=Sedimentisphaera cyanobacteriorum TaxID=1940790 RepID=A0A1Q2HR14_9BACT|nr:30S ribosomal protein S9 [Sedimentisphaera cyanobacteriorum]
MNENTQTPLIDPSIAGQSDAQAVQGSSQQKKAKPDKGGFFWGVGRRKSSVARVRIKPGSGKLTINEKKLKEFFRLQQDQEAVLAPLKECDAMKSFDVFINVEGGGTTGQAGAALLGLARAMANYDESSFSKPLRDAGLLTRDGRMKERKKPGQPGARRRFQFSKR